MNAHEIEVEIITTFPGRDQIIPQHGINMFRHFEFLTERMIPSFDNLLVLPTISQLSNSLGTLHVHIVKTRLLSMYAIVFVFPD